SPVERRRPKPPERRETMDVQHVTTAAGSAQTVTAKKSSLDYDAFLQLLVAQMQNQDPTNPVDPTTQMAQLASFSQVEQAIMMNARLDALLTSSALAQADGVIGRTITSADGTVSGEVVALRVATGGAVAVLEDGRQVPIVAGTEIS